MPPKRKTKKPVEMEVESEEEDEELPVDPTVVAKKEAVPPPPPPAPKRAARGQKEAAPTEKKKVAVKTDENDEDEDEEDEELPNAMDVAAGGEGGEGGEDEDEEDAALSDKDGSAVYVDAEAAVAANKWDVDAWVKLLDEVEKGRGKKGVSVVDTYAQFLESFPRASRFWVDLVNYHLKRGEADAVDAAFAQCLEKCRSVPLWLLYIKVVQARTVGTLSKYSDEYPVQRKLYETAFETAIQNVGTFVGASPIWRAYIDFVKDWPEVGQLDSGRKLSALRDIYQRCVAIPLDAVDEFWSEYEKLEGRAGEQQAQQLLAEYHGRKDHARTVLKDRRALISGKIRFDRLAQPAQNTLSELEQLSYWKQLIHFELSNPENAPADALRKHMLMVFDQALCTMRFYPEVWLGVAQFVASGEEVGSVAEARDLLAEACRIIPTCSLLCVAAAELEEREGNIDETRIILKNMFKSQPSAFSFAVLQRFVRRVDGLKAARQLFTSTAAARKDTALAPALGHGIYMAHSMLEMDVNGAADVALKVLELGAQIQPAMTGILDYVRLKAHVLTRLQAAVPLRAVMEGAIGGLDAAKEASSEATNRTTKSDGSQGSSSFTLQERLSLWDDYIRLDSLLNQSSVVRLDAMRHERNAFAALVREQQRVRGDDCGDAGTDLSASLGAAHVPGLMDATEELVQRYRVVGSAGVGTPLSDADEQMYARNRSDKPLLDQLLRADRKRLAVIAEAGRKARGDKTVSDQDMAMWSGVPPFLRDLLSRLPRQSAATVDVGVFIEHIKSTLLPPRPQVATDGDVGLSRRGPFSKRSNNDEDDEPNAHLDDPFRNRKRIKLSGFGQK
jgi:hypothetical protein